MAIAQESKTDVMDSLPDNSELLISFVNKDNDSLQYYFLLRPQKRSFGTLRSIAFQSNSYRHKTNTQVSATLILGTIRKEDSLLS